MLLYLVNRVLDFVQLGGPVYEQGDLPGVSESTAGDVEPCIRTPTGTRVIRPLTPWGHEYHCEACKPTRKGRLFKRPDLDDHERYEQARLQLLQESGLPVPDEEIPP